MDYIYNSINYLTVLLGIGERKGPYFDNDDSEKIPTYKIAEIILAAVILNKYSDKMDHSENQDNYSLYDGTKLPYPSGMSVTHAYSTYLSHGSNKTEAIEKFIDLHLRTPRQVFDLIQEIKFNYLIK